ncbi:MFS transporter [Streptomyces sp. NPDC002514]|uniref:MFS transporter n=1 Tax=Streptomyces sp. NPDC001270 TaxID=3364554 RepID=UPI000D20E380|nr:MFS transporter permease subunit [Streptomyces sp.]
MAADTAAPVERKRWLALYTLCAGTLMIVLDGSVVTVALPTIGKELDFSQSNLAWLVNAYMIAFGGLLLLSGRLGDLIGRKRMFIGGITLFSAASLLCALAGSQGMLIFGRFVQGVGGAMASAVTLGMIVTMFLEPRDQAKAIGIFSFVAAAGGSIGVIAGGVLTEAAGWNSIFYINVPIGVVILFAASRLFDTDRGLGFGAGADMVGAVLVTGGLMLLVFAINRIDSDGLGSAQTLGFGGLAIVMLIGFVLRQAKAKTPLLPLRIFRSRYLSGANGVMVLFVAGLFGFQFLLALYLQSVAGYSSIKTGMAYLPGPIVIAVISLGYSAKLITRFGPRRVLLVGMVVTTVALGLLGRLPVDASYAPDVLPSVILLGVGAGLALPAVMGLAMSSATPADSGLASGLINTTQQIGGALGVAILATLAGSRSDTLLGQGKNPAEAMTGGYHVSFLVAAALEVVGVALAAFVLRAPKAAAAPADAAEQGVEDAALPSPNQN